MCKASLVNSSSPLNRDACEKRITEKSAVVELAWEKRHPIQHFPSLFACLASPYCTMAGWMLTRGPRTYSICASAGGILPDPLSYWVLVTLPLQIWRLRPWSTGWSRRGLTLVRTWAVGKGDPAHPDDTLGGTLQPSWRTGSIRLLDGCDEEAGGEVQCSWTFDLQWHYCQQCTAINKQHFSHFFWWRLENPVELSASCFLGSSWYLIDNLPLDSLIRFNHKVVASLQGLISAKDVVDRVNLNHNLLITTVNRFCNFLFVWLVVWLWTNGMKEVQTCCTTQLQKNLWAEKSNSFG